jgi:hypothetical protein
MSESERERREREKRKWGKERRRQMQWGGTVQCMEIFRGYIHIYICAFECMMIDWLPRDCSSNKKEVREAEKKCFFRKRGGKRCKDKTRESKNHSINQAKNREKKQQTHA